jgi:hypothetical protein
MRPNKLRELLKANKPTLSTHIHTTWPSVVEAIGHTGLYEPVLDDVLGVRLSKEVAPVFCGHQAQCFAAASTSVTSSPVHATDSIILSLSLSPPG